MDGKKCRMCEYRKESKDRDGFSFLGCYHNPHNGMWIGMVKVCPREGNVKPEPIDCITKLSNDIQRELYDGKWGGEKTT